MLGLLANPSRKRSNRDIMIQACRDTWLVRDSVARGIEFVIDDDAAFEAML